MFNLGDRVIINPLHDSKRRFVYEIFIVKKTPTGKNQVNYLLESVSSGLRLKARAESLVAHDPDKKPWDTAAAVIRDVPVPDLDPGALVRFKSELHVVTSVYPNGTYKLSPLGGSKRYWRHVSREQLTVINLENVKIVE